MINPPDKSESQNQANENPVDSMFTRDALEPFEPNQQKDQSLKNNNNKSAPLALILEVIE